MLTKKHFTAIAAVIRAAVDDLGYTPTPERLREHNAVVRIAERLADVCASENPNFDRGRFLDACGLGGS